MFVGFRQIIYINGLKVISLWKIKIYEHTTYVSEMLSAYRSTNMSHEVISSSYFLSACVYLQLLIKIFRTNIKNRKEFTLKRSNKSKSYQSLHLCDVREYNAHFTVIAVVI